MVEHCFIQIAENLIRKDNHKKAATVYGMAAGVEQRKFRETGLPEHGEKTYMYRKHAARAMAFTHPRLAAPQYGSAAKATERLFSASTCVSERLGHILNCAGDANAAAELFGNDTDNVYFSLGVEAYALIEAYRITREKSTLKQVRDLMIDMARFKPSREALNRKRNWLGDLKKNVTSLDDRLQEALKEYSILI